jgi:hypothetical protein
MEVRRLTLTCAFAALSTVALQGVASAALVEITNAPAPHVAGHTSFKFKLNLDPGENVVNIIGEFRAPGNNMHQVHRPGDLPTFTNDFEGSFPGSFTNEDDSQFDFSIFDWGSSLQDMDTTSELIAFYADPVDSDADPFPIAHIVIPTISAGTFDITVNYEDPLTNPQDRFIGVFAIPEVSQVLAGSALGVGIFGAYVVRRHVSKRRAVAA